MYLNSFSWFNYVPHYFKLVLHVVPGFVSVFYKLSELNLGLILNLKQTIFTLNKCCFFHQEFKLSEICGCSIISVILLDHNCSKFESLWAFIHLFRVHHDILYLVDVCDAEKEVFLVVDVELLQSLELKLIRTNPNNSRQIFLNHFF